MALLPSSRHGLSMPELPCHPIPFVIRAPERNARNARKRNPGRGNRKVFVQKPRVFWQNPKIF